MGRPIVVLGGNSALAAELWRWVESDEIPTVLISRSPVRHGAKAKAHRRTVAADLFLPEGQDRVIKECEEASLVVYMIGTSLRRQSELHSDLVRESFMKFLATLMDSLHRANTPVLACSTNLLHLFTKTKQEPRNLQVDLSQAYTYPDFYTNCHHALQAAMGRRRGTFWITLPRIDHGRTPLSTGEVLAWLDGQDSEILVKEPCTFRRSIPLASASKFVARAAHRIFMGSEDELEPITTRRERNLEYFQRQVDGFNRDTGSAVSVVASHPVVDHCALCPKEFEPSYVRLERGLK